MLQPKRILAVLLCLALLVQIVPTPVWANPDGERPEEETSAVTASNAEEIFDENDSEDSKPVYVVGEMSERRAKSEKHFRMDDGSFVAVDYGAPVHYSTDGGETWNDIDNTLALSRNDAELYVAENGDSVRGFASSLGTGRLLAVSDGAYGLRFGLPETADNADSEKHSAAVAEISYPGEKTRGNEELPFAEQVTPSKLRTEVLYRNVYDGVDLSYVLYSHDVKESILVNQPRESYAFSFKLDTDELVPALVEDGSIELQNANSEVIYRIPAPYMIDADGTESDAVSYTLEEAESGAWMLTVTADADWINDAERAFPVAIDPTIYFAGNSTNEQIFSGYINDNSPNTHPADSSYYIRCGNYQNSGETAGHAIGLIYVNKLPSIPDNCVVTTSMLKLFQALYSNNSYEIINGKKVYTYFNYPRLYTSQINDPSFSTNNPEAYINNVTWTQFFGNVNNISNVYYGNGDALDGRTTLDYTKCHYGTMGDHFFEITETTRQWYEGSTDISRLLVLDDGHNLSINARASFSGYGNDNFGHQPQLIVFYRNTVGVEGYYDYHSQSIGRAGTANVNNFTLGMCLSVPVFSAPSAALPFGLSLVYNGPISYTNFTSSNAIHTANYTTSSTGYGWKTSVQQSVKTIMLTGSDGNDIKWLIYTDGDGTEHYFKRKDQTSVYEDEDGLGLTITVNNTDNPTTFTMKDKENNTWTFLYGYLSSYVDNNGNALYYAYNGYNYSSGSTNWKPTNSNTVYRVTSVWRQNSGASSATKLVTLEYNNANQLSAVVDQSSRRTELTYNNGELVKIKYPDSQEALYTYGTKTVTDPQTNASRTYHRLIKARDDEAQYEIRYGYQNGTACRVKTIQEYAGATGSETPGAIMRGYKGSALSTEFRYCGADNTLETADDLTAKYAFDNWGRPIYQTTMDKDKETIIGVSAGDYTQNSGTNKDNNRLTHAGAGGLQSVNLLNNSGLEHSTALYGWSAAGVGSVAAVQTSNTASTVEITPRTGAYMMKLYLGASNSDGTETCYQTVYLEEDKTYVFSAYVNTAAVSNLGTGGAWLSFRTSSGAEISDASSRVLNYRTSTTVDNGWERLEAAYTPSATGAYQVAVNLSHMTKVIVVDDLQLEAVPDLGGIENEASASTANLIQLGGFSIPTANGPDATSVTEWWAYYDSTLGSSTANWVSVENGDVSRGKVLRLLNHPSRRVRVEQEVKMNVPATQTFLVSAWGKNPVGYTSNGTNLKYDNMTYERFFGIIVQINYAGYSTPEHQEHHYIAFSSDISDWQYTAGVIAPEHSDRTIDTIKLIITGDLLPNDTYVDDVTLIREPVQTYTYDENGNLIAATNSEGQTSAELDSQERLKKYTAMNGVVYNLTYEGSSRQPKTIVSDGITTTYTYDPAGNTTNIRVQAPNNGKYLESGAGYDSTRNFQTEATDTNGNTSYSSYNAAKGLLTSSTNPKGITTNYTYNANNDRVASTYQNGNDKIYLYYQYDEKGRLKQLNRKDYQSTVLTRQGYHFDYDAWGNTTSIKVGSVSSDTSSSLSTYITLASYVYNVDGTLARMNYPGGQYVTYAYDKLDRLIREVYYKSDNTVAADYRYVYNANGQLAKQYTVETVNGIVTIVEHYSFEYDSLGRLIRSREGEGNNLVQRTGQLYDQAGRVTVQNWIIGNHSFSEQYSYSDADGTMTSFDLTFTLPSGSSAAYHLNYNYDALNRLEKAAYTYNDETTPIYTRNYSYQNYTGSTTRTTSRLGTYTVKYHDTDLLTGNQYEYDANGNIEVIQEAYTSGSTIAYRPVAEYVYDDLNQLKTETRKTYTGTSTTPTTTTVVSYTIDTAGNIIQSQTTVNGTTTETISYSYGSTHWSDRLTAVYYNGTGKNITYSGSSGYCNPATWFNGTEYTNLTWAQGRRLSSITKGSDTYEYGYDMSGVRSVKVADGKRHEYVTQNGRVVREIVKSYESSTNDYTHFEYALDFTYDEVGHPLTMRRYFNEALSSYITMHYICNAQGDVVKLINNGIVYAEYCYDTWGRVLEAKEYGSYQYAAMNPLRYRGYYYDTETGFYYLQSRYYDPIVKRFINADSYSSTGQGFLGYNMFAYCGNNPVVHSDSMGQKYIESIDTNGDGEPDCEVYSYTFAANVTVAIDPYFSVHLAESGRIYFLTTITEPKDLDNPDNWPEGYDPTHDYLCIDSLNYEEDPNIHLHNSSNCWAEPKMLAITKEIEEYGNNHTNPAYGWGRESYEMVGEWKSHNNVLFSFSEQAKHVDFDRNEKNKGFGYFFFKAVKRVLGIM